MAFPNALDLIRAELERAARNHTPYGRFLILSSLTIDAERLVSNRLGTRAGTYRLCPIALSELPHVGTPTAGEARPLPMGDLQPTAPIAPPNAVIPMNTLWMRGGFPESLLASDDAASFSWRDRYIESLCARGYQHINSALSASTVREILLRIAATQGEPFTVDRSRLEQKACIDHLEDVGLIRQLRPWFSNELKRFEKNPKIYIRDSGILHCLLNRHTLDQLRNEGYVLGHSWEGFCIEQLVTAAPHARPFFYRVDQNEIDLVLEFPCGKRLAIEIKSLAAKLGEGFEAALAALAQANAYVVRPVPESFDNKTHRVMTLQDMIQVVRTTSAPFSQT